MTRFAVSLLRLAALVAFGSASTLASAQALVDHNKVLAGNVTPGDGAGYPLTLSKPGHYKLMSNLVVPAGIGGVVITSPDVTLDLNGFSIGGPNVCTQNLGTKVVTCSQPGSSIGIDAGTSSVPRSTIRNGIVKGFGKWGIYANDNVRLQGLVVSHNASHGYQGNFDYSKVGVLIEDSLFELNGGTAILMEHGTVMRTRVASSDVGIVAGISGLVQESFVTYNKGVGLMNLVARGTLTESNGVNRSGVRSMGGNMDNSTPF